MTKQEKLKYCIGCENDFYNGHNQLDVKECWNLKDAKIVKRKRIPAHLAPPYDHIKPQKILSCYKQKGYVFWE